MGKNRSASGLTNIIQYDDSGNITFVSGSTTLMSVSSSGAITTTGTISGSDATNALLLDGTGSLAFTTTASYNVASASLSSRTTQVERTYATTGSNTFTGAQFISDTSNAISFTSTASLYSDGGLRVQGNSFVSGTAYFNNIVVYGTSSIQYITSSQVNVGTNIITVNTDTPAVRFGGLAVFDSGSTGLTGSMLWDSEKNHWVYSNPSGSSYSGGMLISGPRSSALGSEQGTTACMLLVGQGGDHLTSSLVYHSSTCTSFYSNTLFVSSSGNVGIGVTPSASDTFPALQVGRAGFMGAGNDTNISANAYYSSPSWKYIATESSALYNISGNVHSWYSAASGTANAAISWIERMRITCTGNVGIGTCSPSEKLDIFGPNASGPSIRWRNDGGRKSGYLYSDSAGVAIYDTNLNDAGIYLAGNQQIDFRVGGSQRMLIACGGNTCVYCQLSVGPAIIVGSQGGTDTTVIGGGSGVGSNIRMNYAGGAFNNYLAGNGDNYFNCLLGKLNAAGGIKFGSGATTLNYYESGTWTPQLYWTGGGFYCMSGINGGNYVRIGNVVSVNYHLQWSGQKSGGSFAGQLRIGGLPFAIGGYRSAGTISAISSGIGRSSTNITWHANTADPGADFIYWIENDPGGGYGHSPSVSTSGLVYSNQLTYTLQ